MTKPKVLHPKEAVRILQSPEEFHLRATYDLMRAANYALALAQEAYAEIQRRAERGNL